MEVQAKEIDDALIISLTGKMMLGYEAQDFHEVISSSLEKNRNKIIVDLSNVEFISSWGIGILIHGYTTVINRQGNFTLVSVPDIVSDALEKTKLDKIFEKYASVEEALNK
jgi:anti-sigma B factor antagonist